MKDNLKRQFAYFAYLITTICIGMGLYKLFVYSNVEGFEDTAQNAYVGGDAYNYIINAGQATAYFTLGIIFVILGSGMLILDKMECSYMGNYSKIHERDISN